MMSKEENLLLTPAEKRASECLGAVGQRPRIQAWLSELNTGSTAAVPRTTRSKVVRRYYVGALAASVAITVSAIAWLRIQTDRYETHIGEQRDVPLEDGSRMTLNTNTKLLVHYSKTRRLIELERGEATFTVSRDAVRPFDVAVGGTLVRALGTEFNVEMRPTTITVSVLEGAVRVDEQSQPAAPRVPILSKGEAIAINTAAVPGTPLPSARFIPVQANLRRIDGWRAQRLEFVDETLGQAVEEFNRYSTTHVAIGSPDLESVHVNGVFRIGDVKGFLFSMRATLGVSVVEAQGQVTLVR